MKNNKISLIISIVALVGVILLLVDKFSHTSSDSDSDHSSTESAGDISVAYVNLDSVLNSYDLYNLLSLNFAQKQQDLEKELQSKMLSLQNRAYQLQQQFSQHLITTQTYQEKGQKLSDDQMLLQQWQEEKMYELQEDQMLANQRVMDSVISIINEMNADEKYDLIINTNSMNTTLLYGNPGWNISNEVIEELNAKLGNEFFTDTTVTQ